MAHTLTPKATLSFPALFTPKPRSQTPGAEPVYSCALLFDKEAQRSPEYKAMQTAVVKAAKEKFGDDVNLKTLSLPFRDGAEKDYSGYGAGVTFISPWSKNKPGVVDGRLQDVLMADSVWAGQQVRASVSAFAWAHTGKKGVSFGLNHVQIMDASGPRLDGRAAAKDSFTALEELEDSPF